MSLENKVLELYNKEYKSVKLKKLIGLLKVVLVDKEEDLYKIEKMVPITKTTIKKYIMEKDVIIQYITEEEYNLFLKKVDSILETEKNQQKKEEFTLVARIIDEILNTRHKIEDICANNFFTFNRFKKLLSETTYIEENFGIGVKEKVQEKIDKNGKDRMKVPRNMFLIQDRYHVFVAKNELIYLDEFDYRRLTYTSDYLCSGADLDFVTKKRETNVGAVFRILSDKKLEAILKKEYYEMLKKYLEIENLLLSGDLNKKKEVLYDLVECLYENNLNKQAVMEHYKLPECLFNKLLLELIKLPYFNTEIKRDAKKLLNIEEEKKVK